jgi:hypothetical protein
MNESEKYNGWTNYETWLVNLWMDNDSGSQEYWTESALEFMDSAIESEDDSDSMRNSAAYYMGESIKESHDEFQPDECITGVYADLLNASLRSVNWYEIAKHYIDEITLYSAGWNMPGYMPDSDVLALFTDSDSAMEYLRESIESDESLDHINTEYMRPDSKGEFGVTIGNFHYFVSEV